MTKVSKLLIDEYPLQVLPNLAKTIGLNEAIILQQVKYWLVDKEKNKSRRYFIDGRYWIYNGYPDWQKQFPFWHTNTIRRAIRNLEKRGLLISMQKRQSDRRKWYTIDYNAVETLVVSPSYQNDALEDTDSV